MDGGIAALTPTLSHRMERGKKSAFESSSFSLLPSIRFRDGAARMIRPPDIYFGNSQRGLCQFDLSIPSVSVIGN